MSSFSFKNISAFSFSFGFALVALFFNVAAADTRTFQEVAVEINGAKLWLPSTLIANKGDIVKIHAVSKVRGKNSVH